MEIVNANFKVFMNRVHIIYALAECIGMDEVVKYIEGVSGKVENEGELVRLEKQVFDRVLELRATDKWPPQKGRDAF